MADGSNDKDLSTGDDSGVGLAELPATAPASVPPARVIPPVSRTDLSGMGPRKGGLIAAIFYALATLSLGYPEFAGKCLAGPNSDQFVAGYAFREFGAAMLKSTGG